MTPEGRSALRVLNSAVRPAVLDGLDTGLPEGQVPRSLGAFDGPASPERVVGLQGRVARAQAASGGWVRQTTGERCAVAGAAVRLALDPPGAPARPAPTRPRLLPIAAPMFVERTLGIGVRLVATALAARLSDSSAAAFSLAQHVFAMLFILFRVVGAGVGVVWRLAFMVDVEDFHDPGRCPTS
jgi:hypothetical protein